MDSGLKGEHRTTCPLEIWLLLLNFEIVVRPGVYRQAPSAISRLLSKNFEDERDFIDEVKPALDIQCIERCHAASVIFAGQESASRPTPAEMMEAQN